MINKFDGDEVPKELVAHLSRFHRITTDAAPLAADVFIRTAKYCGVLNDNNILNFKNLMLKASDPNFQFGEVKAERDSSNSAKSAKEEPIIPLLESVDPDSQLQLKSETPLLTEMVNEEKVKIRLTGKKFAYLTYPDNLTQTDIEILKKQIEQLELMIE